MRSLTFPTPWLGSKYGYLTDCVTQILGAQYRTPDRSHFTDSWLLGLIGNTPHIGKAFFTEPASESHLDIAITSQGRGLIYDFSVLANAIFDPAGVSRDIVDFYEHTSDYQLVAWVERCVPPIRLGRLQQLNVPLSGLHTSRGGTTDIILQRDKQSGAISYTAWVRELVGPGNVLYAGSYSV